MAYVLLAFALLYSLLWAIGLVLTLRSPDRSLPIPVLGTLGFLGLTGFAGLQTSASLDHPHKLTADTFNKLSDGMTPDQVMEILGEPKALEEKMDIAAFHINYPDAIKARISSEKRFADRVDADVKIKIAGEPSKARLSRGEGLGAPANKERGGVWGLDILLIENGNETHIKEGEHWTYEDDMTAEVVTQKIAEAIDATDAWVAATGGEDEPTVITIKPELEANLGTGCNENRCTVQVVAASEPKEEGAELDVTGAVRIRAKADGKVQDFRGGEEAVVAHIWFEKGVLLDTDFSREDRIIVAAFQKEALVGLSQAGLGIAPVAAAPAEGAE